MERKLSLAIDKSDPVIISNKLGKICVTHFTFPLSVRNQNILVQDVSIHPVVTKNEPGHAIQALGCHRQEAGRLIRPEYRYLDPRFRMRLRLATAE